MQKTKKKTTFIWKRSKYRRLWHSLLFFSDLCDSHFVPLRLARDMARTCGMLLRSPVALPTMLLNVTIHLRPCLPPALLPLFLPCSVMSFVISTSSYSCVSWHNYHNFILNWLFPLPVLLFKKVEGCIDRGRLAVQQTLFLWIACYWLSLWLCVWPFLYLTFDFRLALLVLFVVWMSTHCISYWSDFYPVLWFVCPTVLLAIDPHFPWLWLLAGPLRVV